MRPGSTARPRRAPSPRAGEGGFERLFWDHPAGSVRLDTDRDLIVRRVITEGGSREMRLLRSRVGDSAIRDFIQRTDARGLSPQRIRFWQLILGLPPRRANAWVRRAREETWASRTLRRPLEIEGLRLAAPEDIAAMKLAAVAQRGSKKDFIDVFGLGRLFGLPEMLGFSGRCTGSRTTATSLWLSRTSTTLIASGLRSSCTGTPGRPSRP